MIIRTSQRRQYTALPNAMLRDSRLTVGTNGALAFLLALPENWEIRPRQIARQLSAEGQRPLGLKRVYRVLREMSEAGYLARSDEQSRNENGDFGSYIYIVGPDATTVAEVARECGVANSAHSRFAQTPTDRASYKITRILKKPTLPSHDKTSAAAVGLPAAWKGTDRKEHRAFVFIPSHPWSRWMEYLKVAGEALPEPITRVIKGQLRQGAWMPSYRPPGAIVGRASELATQITAAEVQPSAALVRSLRGPPAQKVPSGSVRAALPEPITRVIKGQLRQGAWMPSYRPPGAIVGRASELATQITAAEVQPSAASGAYGDRRPQKVPSGSVRAEDTAQGDAQLQLRAKHADGPAAA
jgi:hypothetical protein